MSGLQGDPRALAVHPDDRAIVAVATSTGVYVSSDSGDTFTAIPSSDGQGTTVFFDLGGKHLWHAGFDGKARLTRQSLPAGETMDMKLPPLSDDAVAYIAQNPVARSEYAIATFERSVYLSSDGGRSWRLIARRGRGN
jgi:hypothetical protein